MTMINKPDPLLKESEVQQLIDKAIAKHNVTASIISACIGAVLLFFYAQGLLIVVGEWQPPLAT